MDAGTPARCSVAGNLKPGSREVACHKVNTGRQGQEQEVWGPNLSKSGGRRSKSDPKILCNFDFDIHFVQTGPNFFQQASVSWGMVVGE